VIAVPTTQTTAKKELFNRISRLSESDLAQVIDFVDSLEGHEPNEETIKAIEKSYDPANLLGPYHSLEEMFRDFGIDVDTKSSQ
jgi:hypothetical protein